MVLTLDDRVAARMKAADFRGWRDRVTAIGGCAAPISLAGAFQIQDLNGGVIEHIGGDVMVPCGNRRESVCPSCSDRYAADAYHLMHAGLAGGSKGVPTSVAEKPRVFATLTAPSFGAVHNRPLAPSGKARPCTGCGEWHSGDDPRIGGAVDANGYDYTGAVLWQAHAGKLWHRFAIALRRKLAQGAGLKVKDFKHHARLSYAKVGEYQRRGLVHFHAVIRIDGPEGPHDATPAWVTFELLDDCIRAAARSVGVDTNRPDGSPLRLLWGEQVDTKAIRATNADQVEDESGDINEARLAGYVAKYATKGTGARDTADRPIKSQMDIDFLRVSEHHKRMIQTAWDLGGLEEFEQLNLRKWAHMLAFRGHFLTKSTRYSTTFKAIRGERQTFRTLEMLEHLELDPNSVLLVNDWQYAGSGYDNDAERELAAAIAERVRDQRKRKYEQEGGHRDLRAA